MHSIIFFGSDAYSLIVLKSLSVNDVLAVVTDRGKPKDRDQVIEPNPIEQYAITHKLKVLYYPDNINELSKIIDKDTIGLCASFDHLLSAAVITLFDSKLYNLHPSLLPQYRNVSPVQYALALGDKVTGITLFKITSGIDNGEIVGQISEPILDGDSTPTLTSRLFEKGANLFLQSSELCKTATTYKVPNLVIPTTPLIFTHRLTRDSGYIEWPLLLKLLNGKPVTPAETKNELLKLRLQKIPTPDIRHTIPDLLRALTPWPGLWTNAATKKGELRLSIESVTPNLTVKLAGKPKPIAWSDFIKYYI